MTYIYIYILLYFYTRQGVVWEIYVAKFGGKKKHQTAQHTYMNELGGIVTICAAWCRSHLRRGKEWDGIKPSI